MKYSITFFLILLTSIIYGQQISYNDWKNAAKTEIRLVPKFGNVIKTKEQKEADQELIKTYLAQQGTHRKASEVLVGLGFNYLYKGDLKTAMFRFNQAWLLDPTNENSFWGFGAVYSSLGNFPDALKQYEEGLLINPKSTNILTDKASIFINKYATEKNEKDFTLAIKLLKQSYFINPNYTNTVFKLSTSYFFKKDCANAWKYYYECKKLGSKLITDEYTKALTNLCKK